MCIFGVSAASLVRPEWFSRSNIDIVCREPGRSELTWSTSGTSQVATIREFVLLVDGRLDNTAELRQMFSDNHASNAELLVLAYLKWKTDFPNHVLGDFAFALWDKAERRLLLGRDISGSRPLFYWSSGTSFCFASHLSDLVRSGCVGAKLDEAHVAEWLALVPHRTHSTFFAGVRSVPPGHTVALQHGRDDITSYWSPGRVQTLRVADNRDYSAGLKDILRRSVADRILDQTVVASQLSSGLDSSSVTAIAAELLESRGGRVTAFTAVPETEESQSPIDDRFANEGPLAAETARFYKNIDHILVSNRALAMFPVLDDLNAATGEPQFNPANCMWLCKISQEAQNLGLNSLLTGVHGNLTMSHSGNRALASLLNRGHLFEACELAYQYRKSGRAWRSIGSATISPFVPDFVTTVIKKRRGTPLPTAADLTGVLPSFLRKYGLSDREISRRTAGSDSRPLRFEMIKRNTLGTHFAAMERLWGVEVSDPTSDKRVIEYCFSVPEEQYCLEGKARSLIKRAMAESLPNSVLTAKKRGLQASDIVPHLFKEKDQMAKELTFIRRHHLLSQAIDLPRFERLLNGWNSDNYSLDSWGEYAVTLPRVVSLARFIRRLEEGTLFSGSVP
jgi:asparagine synthase (glutamine-hydrolysing)